MIFGNVSDLATYEYLEDRLKECFQYAKENDLSNYETCCHKIHGDDLFVNIVEYETTSPENRFWEAHRDYLDLHFMLKGPEQIDVNFIQNMSVKEYVPADDFLPMDGPANGNVVLEEGDFLLCYPADAHRTAIAYEGKSVTIKKAIFKIKIHD